MYNKYKIGDMKKIVLFCAGGMSTSLLVNKMREAAAKQGKEYDINAYDMRTYGTMNGEATLKQARELMND